MEKRTGLFANGIIWFGVAISVSEIEAGIEIGAAAARDSLWLPLVWAASCSFSWTSSEHAFA